MIMTMTMLIIMIMLMVMTMIIRWIVRVLKKNKKASHQGPGSGEFNLRNTFSYQLKHQFRKGASFICFLMDTEIEYSLSSSYISFSEDCKTNLRDLLIGNSSLVLRRSRLGQSWTLPWALTSPKDSPRTLGNSLARSSQTSRGKWGKRERLETRLDK